MNGSRAGSIPAHATNLKINNVRTKMTLIMTALQGASVLLASLDMGNGNALAMVCFLLATFGVWCAQLLNN